METFIRNSVNEIKFKKEDLTTFFSLVLPKVGKEIVVTDKKLFSYKPDELKTEKQLEEERLKAEAEEKAKAQEEEGEVQTTEPAEEVEEEKTEEKEKTFEYLNPELNYTASTESVTDTLTYALTYSLGMNATNQLAYASNNLNKSEDFNWNDIRTSMYNIKVPLSISSKFNYGGNFFSIENKFS